jgi:hypothetical protein
MKNLFSKPKKGTLTLIRIYNAYLILFYIIATAARFGYNNISSKNENELTITFQVKRSSKIKYSQSINCLPLKEGMFFFKGETIVLYVIIILYRFVI